MMTRKKFQEKLLWTFLIAFILNLLFLTSLPYINGIVWFYTLITYVISVIAILTRIVILIHKRRKTLNKRYPILGLLGYLIAIIFFPLVGAYLLFYLALEHHENDSVSRYEHYFCRLKKIRYFILALIIIIPTLLGLTYSYFKGEREVDLSSFNIQDGPSIRPSYKIMGQIASDQIGFTGRYVYSNYLEYFRISLFKDLPIPTNPKLNRSYTLTDQSDQSFYYILDNYLQNVDEERFNTTTSAILTLSLTTIALQKIKMQMQAPTQATSAPSKELIEIKAFAALTETYLMLCEILLKKAQTIRYLKTYHPSIPHLLTGDIILPLFIFLDQLNLANFLKNSSNLEKSFPQVLTATQKLSEPEKSRYTKIFIDFSQRMTMFKQYLPDRIPMSVGKMFAREPIKKEKKPSAQNWFSQTFKHQPK